MKINYKKFTKLTLKLFVSLAFVAWLVLQTNWSEVGEYVQKISIIHVVAYVGVLLLGMAVSSWKWKILLDHKEIHISLKKSFQLYLTGAFINNFMPSTIGGDTYRTYQVGKENKRYSAVGSTVIFDRFTGFFALMLLTGIIAIFQWQEISRYAELRFSVIGILLLMHGFIFFGILTRFSFWKKLSIKFPVIIQRLGNELSHYRQENIYLKVIGISVIFSLIGVALLNWILFAGLGISVGIMQYLSVIFIISIISALPISINNIGLKEWAYVTFFGFFGVAASAVVTVALVSRILQMLVSFVALPMYLRNKN